MQNLQKNNFVLNPILFEVEELEERLENKWSKTCYCPFVGTDPYTGTTVTIWVECSCDIEESQGYIP